MKSAHNIAVLTYHHVNPRAGSLTVSTRQFEQQMRGLARHGFRTLTGAQFAAFLAGAPVPARSVVLTFDDGYLDNWVHAHPILQRHGHRALLFAATSLIGDGPVRANDDDATGEICLPHAVAKDLMFTPERDQVMLRWAELRAMVAAGTFEVHSHTHTHQRWDLQLDDPAARRASLHDDLLASRATLEKELGDASTHLCWPQGYFDDDYVAVARALGFAHLYTTDPRGQNRMGGDALYIHRVGVRNRPWGWLRHRLWLATHPTLGPLYNRWKLRADRRHGRRRRAA